MMKKKLAMLLALVMTVTSIEGSALAVRGADFGSELVQIAEEAEPQAAAEEASAESFGSEASEESFSDEFTAEEAPEIEAGTEEAGEIFGSEETESIPEIGEEETEPQDASGEEIFQTEESFEGEETPQEEAIFGDEVQAVEEDFAAEVGSVIPQEGVTTLELSVDYPANIDTPGKMEWFSFTPTETGKYSFSSNSEDGDVDAQAYLYDAQGEVLSSDDQSKGSNNDFLLTYMLEAGQTYYYCAKSWYEDKTGFFTVRLEKQRSIEAVKVDNIVSDIPEGFGNLYHAIERAIFTITYADGTEPYVYENSGSWISSISDPYGNQIDIELLTEEGLGTDGDNLQAGNYQIQLKWEGRNLATYPIQVVPVEESSWYSGELQNGENQIVTYEDNYKIFKYTPSETAEYAFTGAGDITVKTANPAGGLENVESNGMKCAMEQGKSYYLTFSWGGENTVHVAKTVALDGASLENIASDIPEGFGNLGLAVNNSVITVTYADGTEPYVYTNDGNWLPSFNDPYGNYIYSRYLNEDGSEADMYNPKAGTYQIQLKCEDSVLGTYLIKVVPVEESRRYGGELQNGENQIIAGDDEIGTRIFKYIPSETAEYAFTGAGDITVKTANPAGGLEDVEPNGMKCAMEQGKSYYLCFSYYGECTVNVMKAINISEVSIDTSESKTEFLVGIENYSPEGIKLSVSYEDGSSEILTYEYDTEVRDSKGNIFSYSIWKDETEFDQWDNLDAGTYEIRIQCNYEEIPGISYTVTFGEGENLRLLQKGINSQVESPDGEYAWYRFIPDTDALYLFNPAEYMSVYKKVKGGTPEELNSYSGGIYRLEAEAEYLVGLSGSAWIHDPETGEGDYYNTFDMEIREIPELTGIQAKVVQTEGLAGVSYYTGAELVCTYSDNTSKTVKWDVGDTFYNDQEGLYINNIITDKDGKEYCLGDSLAAGTYSLKFQNVANVESNPVEIQIVSDITETSLLTGEVYEGRNPDMESPLNRYAYYGFTVENAGRYRVETTLSEEAPFIRKTKDGYEEAGTSADLEKGETVYIRTHGENYNDVLESCNINIYSVDQSKTLSWNKNEVTVNSRLEDLDDMSEIPAILYKTEENGITRAYEVTFDGTSEEITSDGGSYSVNVEIQDNKTGKVYSIYDFEDWIIPEGNYTVTVIDEGVKSSPLKLNVQDGGLEQYQKLEEKEQTIPVGWGYSYVYYTFCPKTGGTYGLTTDLNSLSININVVSEDGNIYTVYDYFQKMGNAAVRLEAGKTYVIGLSDRTFEKTQAKVALKKLPELKELKINSVSPKKQEYIENISTPKLGLAETEICFEDGTSQVVTVGENAEGYTDLYGRELSYELMKKLEDGTYEPLEWAEYYPAGEYAYRIVFDSMEDKAAYIPVKITPLKDYNATVLSESGKTVIENQGTFIKLQYTAKEEGRYEIRFNVPVYDVSIGTEQGEEITEYSSDSYHLYADLKKGTYDICLKAENNENSALAAEVVFLSQKVEGLKTTVSKDRYIAGYDRLHISDLVTEVTIGGKTYKVSGEAEINGYSVKYRITNGKEELWDDNVLPAGTWTITPYLTAGYSEDYPKVILEGAPVTIQAALPDFDNLPALAEDWMEIEDTGNGTVYYKFTAPQAGVYSYETEAVQASGWLYAQLYKINNNTLTGNSSDNRLVALEKNETCFVVVNTSGGGRIRFIRYPYTAENSIILQNGTDTYVSQKTEKITAEFTPEESGYYMLELEGMGLPEIVIGGEYCGSGNCEYLQKGKTYRYVLSREYYDEQEELFYRLTYKKIETKKIKNVSLVVNEEFIENNPLTVFSAACQKRVTYEDGTASEPMDLYQDDAYGNEFRFHLETSSLKTDKEIVYDTYFEYRMPGEAKWHKTEVEKTTLKLDLPHIRPWNWINHIQPR